MSDVLSGDVFDIREAIERFEELEDIEDRDEEEREEFTQIQKFLDEVRGYGGDHQWRGDWYPVTFIANHHFEEYAQKLAEDIGAIDRSASWPNDCIDWKRAARKLQQDYSSVEIDGTIYWYR